MASLKNYRSDILLLLQKSKISKDFRVNPRHIEHLINRYRAIAIRQNYSKTLDTDTSWLQDMGSIPTTTVTSADDPIIPISSVTLSKITIPTVVQLPSNAGIYRMSSATKQITYYPVSQPRFFDFVQGSLRTRFDYYFKVGTSIYVNSLVDFLNPILILDNPLEGTIYDTTDKVSGTLVIGTLYQVQSGTIVHNAIQYNAPQTFTAVNSVFLGTGKVQLVNQIRPFTVDDEYPMSFTLAEMIMLKILTQDFKIEESQVSDIRNDSQDELIVMQGEKA
jgi:hypothetical protein